MARATDSIVSPTSDAGTGEGAEKKPREPTPEPLDIVKATFNLPRRELNALKRIAAIRGVTATQAFRQAIAILAFLTDLPQGSTLHVREPNGNQREVVFQNF
jgi:hypothetical protein